MFNRKKKGKEPKQKKKWQMELDNEEGETSSVADEITCSDCKGERDAVVHCSSCKKYFCRVDFIEQHPNPTLEFVPPPKKASPPPPDPALPPPSEEQKKKDEEQKQKDDAEYAELLKTAQAEHKKELLQSYVKIHKFRPLVGAQDLDTLEVGWMEGSSFSQVEILEIRNQKEQERQRNLARSRSRSRSPIDSKRLSRSRSPSPNYQPPDPSELTDEQIALEYQQQQQQILESGLVPPPTAAAAEKKDEPMRFIFVSNLSSQAQSKDLRNFFKDCGRISDLRLPTETAKGPGRQGHKGHAFLEFDTHEGALKAAAKNLQLFLDRPIRINLCNTLGIIEKPKEKPQPFKTRMCMYFAQGMCHKDDKCTFAHHPRELQGGPQVAMAALSAAARGNFRSRGYRGRGGPPGRGRGSVGVDGGFKW